MSKDMTIREASARTNLPSSTLRYYERIGLIKEIRRDENGYRQFSERDIDWIEFVKCMQKTGMPLDDLRQFADLHRQRTDLQGRLDIIRAHLTRVETQQAELADTHKFLLSKIGRFEEAINRQKEQNNGETANRQE